MIRLAQAKADSKGAIPLDKAIEILKECGADGWVEKKVISWLQFHSIQDLGIHYSMKINYLEDNLMARIHA